MVGGLPLSPLGALVLLAGALLLSIAVVTLWSGTQTRAARWFLLLVVADAVWAVSSVVTFRVGAGPVAVTGTAVSVAASSAVALSWFGFGVVYTGRVALTRRRLAALTIPFVGYALALVTDSVHGIPVRSAEVSPRVVTMAIAAELPPASLLVAGYGLALVLVGTALVARTALVDPDLFPDQTLALLVGSVVPIAGGAATATGAVGAGAALLTPATVAVGAVGYGYALFRADLLTIGPLLATEGREVAVDSLEEGILIADGSGEIIDTNSAARGLLGVVHPVGEPLDAVLPIADGYEPGREVLRTEEGIILEAQIMSLSETDRRGIGWVVTLRDVTERHRRRERLQVFNRVLRHNLRNELGIVRGFAQQIAAGNGNGPDDREAARRITHHADDLLRIAEKARTVEELIDVDEPADREVVALSSLLADRAAEISAAADRPVELNTDLPETCRIRSNEAVLDMVFTELLENAIQHNYRPKPAVWVTASVDDQVRIRVADDGPGMPEMDRRAVLDGTETQLEHGTQIGLWTVRWGVRYLGGSLSIEARSPTGTAVEVYLPGETVDESEG